ncbi:MAG: peptide transporter [Methanobacteriaceae archaeon]|nr:peptide transporter [Methanobacteriaceae archaeon]
MNQKVFIRISIILLIFFIGFIMRVETTHLDTLSDMEKHYYQDQNGLPYMYELDSYYNYRLTENYLNHGYLGDAKINGVEWDLHSYYPPGVPLDYPPLIVYLTALIYKFINLFADIPLLVVCFWLSAFIAPLAGIAAYFLVGRLTNQYGAVAAGILSVTIPYYFVRTVPGWFDTDMFNLLFPFLVVGLFFSAMENINSPDKKGLIYSCLTAISLFLFSLAWNGWQYLFYLISIFWAVYIIISKIRGENIAKHLYNLLLFSAVTLMLVWLFTGFVNILKLVFGPLQLVNLSYGGGSWADWPNLYTSVSELIKPSVEVVISSLGITLFAGLFGLVWTFRLLLNEELSQKFIKKMRWITFSFLVFWTLAGFITLNSGERFLVMLIPPLVVNTGIMVGICTEYLGLLKNTNQINFFKKHPSSIKVLSVLIVILAVLPGMWPSENSFLLTPGINDDIWAVSVWINNNTPKNTVIVGDWNNGHLYTAIANRPVLEDGRMGYIETLPVRNYDDLFPYKDKSPSISRDYWINKAFSTDNETLSLGIMRMLSTSGDQGYITLDMYVGNTSKSVEILNHILGIDRSNARNLLLDNYNINENQADEVLKYTHPDKPSPFVVVTNDKMIGIGHWIFQFGEWDFNEKSSQNYIYSVGRANTTSDFLNSTNDIFMDFKTGNLTWENKTPYFVEFIDNRTIVKRFMDPNSDFGVFIINGKKAVVMDKKFENSIFTKLVIENNNSTVFKPLYYSNRAVVWAII